MLIVEPTPTFGMYRFSANLVKGNVLSVPRNDKFDLDVGKIAAAVNRRSKIIFIASPNNPTGNLATIQQIAELLQLGIVVVVDEAYHEYCGETVLPLLQENSNLIILRTFSKWAGLAGLRVGYGAFSTGLLQELWKIKQPYNVSVAATEAALASLSDSSNLLQVVSKIRSERKRLSQMLSGLPFLFPYPSHGNFVLCEVKGMNALSLHQALSTEGILVRYFDKPRLRDHIRVSVGLPQHTDFLLTILSRIAKR